MFRNNSTVITEENNVFLNSKNNVYLENKKAFEKDLKVIKSKIINAPDINHHTQENNYTDFSKFDTFIYVGKYDDFQGKNTLDYLDPIFNALNLQFNSIFFNIKNLKVSVTNFKRNIHRLLNFLFQFLETYNEVLNLNERYHIFRRSYNINIKPKIKKYNIIFRNIEKDLNYYEKSIELPLYTLEKICIQIKRTIKERNILENTINQILSERSDINEKQKRKDLRKIILKTKIEKFERYNDLLRKQIIDFKMLLHDFIIVWFPSYYFTSTRIYYEITKFTDDNSNIKIFSTPLTTEKYNERKEEYFKETAKENINWQDSNFPNPALLNVPSYTEIQNSFKSKYTDVEKIMVTFHITNSENI